MKKKNNKRRGLTAESLIKGLIITPDEARKILGIEARDLEDEELEEILYSLAFISHDVIEMAYKLSNRVTG